MLARLLNIFIGLKDNTALRKVGLAFAVLIFAISLIWALTQNPDLFRSLSWTPFLILLLIGVPLSFALNALDICLTARLANSSIGFIQALKVAIISRAANLLPLPGGPLVRIEAIKDAGGSYKKSTAATLIAGLLWLGVSFFLAGICLLHISGPIGLSVILLGSIILTASLVVGFGVHKDAKSLTNLLFLKIAATVVAAFRLGLCLWALTGIFNIGQAVVLAAATVSASAIFILPDGLGAREAFSGGLGALIGIGASTGVLAAVLNRIAGLITLFPIALLVVAKSFTRQKKSSPVLKEASDTSAYSRQSARES